MRFFTFHRIPTLTFLLCSCVVSFCRASVGGLHHYQQLYDSRSYHTLSPSLHTSRQSRSSLSNLVRPGNKQIIRRRRGDTLGSTLLASASSSHDRRSDKPPEDVTGGDISSYEQLTWLGKVVAGITEVAVTVIIEYATGFVGGYFLGSLIGVPTFFMSSLDKPSNVQKYKLWNEFTGRSLRLHRKSMSWATNLGGISAAFGGFRVAARVCRNGKEDEWTSILSSMAAGAYFARSEGPQAMLRGALLYGGLMYLLSGNLLNRQRRQPFEYNEEAMEF